ncbi:MAG: zinc ribbon domain-containing protein [Chloroflexi bacterium]|nr:zinc ribbon domain-containing protein [Chloroflexota bacterium]
MPVYEYRCQDCRRLVRLTFSFAEYGQVEPVCSHCASTNLTRKINRIAVAKSEDARMDSLMDDSALANLSEDDPRAMGQFMRKMSREMGEDMGDEFNEVVERLEKGESPEAIEQSMPDLGAGDEAF